ncbi:MAG TPA: GDSL-type esterase/lipase family protein [Candidatus Saccharimonadales bacterium]|nr:GDSL-type esterase/lipase family protein [Candidatus Saccharimonadales bacterium]
MAQILVFGTSITYGAWDSEGGWVARLRKYIDAKTIASNNEYCLVYNLGISGDTTDGILQRFEEEARRRIAIEDKDVTFLFHVGINDSIYLNTEKQFRVPKEEFRKNLKTLISHARKITQKIIFIGLSPVDDSLVDPIPWASEKSYKNKHVKEYDQILQDVCREEHVNFIDTLSILNEKGGQNLLCDGVHLTSEGHAIIFETVRKFLEEQKII